MWSKFRGFWILDLGDFGFWIWGILDVGFGDFGFWILDLGDFWFWILGILDFGFWGFWILDCGDFGSWILDRYVANLYVRPPTPQIWGFWILDFGGFGDFGFWIWGILDFGFWGFWILDFEVGGMKKFGCKIRSKFWILHKSKKTVHASPGRRICIFQVSIFRCELAVSFREGFTGSMMIPPTIYRCFFCRRVDPGLNLGRVAVDPAPEASEEILRKFIHLRWFFSDFSHQ